MANKKHKQWIWLALDIETKRHFAGEGFLRKDTSEIVGVYIGNRSLHGASRLWRSLPALYRQCAMCYTDFWAAYNQIFPASRHRFVSKTSGKTNGIERFNCTLRQRVSRLVRKTLSCSKKLENHIGALLVFYPSL